MILNFFAALMFSCLTSKAIDIEHHHDPTSQNRNGINVNQNSAQSITDAINGVESKKAEERYRHAVEQLNERQQAIDAKDEKIRQIEAENAALQQKINELRTDNDLSEQIQRVEKRAVEADAEHRKVINLSEIPDISESEFDYAFQSPQGQVRNELVFLYSNFLKIDPYYKNRKRAKEFGLTAVKFADQAEASAQHEEGLLYKEIALEFLDLAIGLHPVTGFAQSTYELIYGSRLLTGAQLTNLDRSLAFLNIVTLGTGKLLLKLGSAADLAGKAMSRLSHLGSDTKAIENAISTGQTICENAAKHGISVNPGPTASTVDKVIIETLQGKGDLISQFKLTTNEALEAARKWVGDGYKELKNRPNSGVFRSADNRRQFRMEDGSITGAHKPDVPHVHFEEVAECGRAFKTNNHVPFLD